MMKNQEHYAVAVRKPDGEIVVEAAEYSGLRINKKIKNIYRCCAVYLIL